MEINFLKFLCDWVRVSDGNLIPWRSLENEVWLPVRGGEGGGVQIESNPQTWAAVQLDSRLFIIHHSTAVGWRLFYMCNKARRDVSERHWQNHIDQPLCCWTSQVRDTHLRLSLCLLQAERQTETIAASHTALLQPSIRNFQEESSWLSLCQSNMNCQKPN